MHTSGFFPSFFLCVSLYILCVCVYSMSACVCKQPASAWPLPLLDAWGTHTLQHMLWACDWVLCVPLVYLSGVFSSLTCSTVQRAALSFSRPQRVTTQPSWTLDPDWPTTGHLCLLNSSDSALQIKHKKTYKYNYQPDDSYTTQKRFAQSPAESPIT